MHDKQYTFKTKYWVTIYESHDSDLTIFIILFANSSDDTRLFGERLIFSMQQYHQELK